MSTTDNEQILIDVPSHTPQTQLFVRRRRFVGRNFRGGVGEKFRGGVGEKFRGGVGVIVGRKGEERRRIVIGVVGR